MNADAVVFRLVEVIQRKNLALVTRRLGVPDSGDIAKTWNGVLLICQLN